MIYFLDTNICIYYMSGKSIKIKDKLFSMTPDRIKIPSIIKAKLLYGAEKSQKRNENIEKITQFLFPLEIIGFNEQEAVEYSIIRSDLEKKGTVIGPNDLIIAATVKANNGILVTNNTNEFKRVRGLKIEDWSK